MIATPHIDRAWRDSFVLHLRERDVPGTRIGEALVHVESFCADSGRSAQEEFGAADTYAASLFDEAPTGPGSTPVSGRVALALSVGVLGMLLAFDVVSAMLTGTPTRATAATLVAAVLILGAAVVVARQVVALARRPWLGALALAGVVLGVVGAQLLLADGPSVTVPTTAAAVLAVGMLVASSAWVQRHERGADVLSDPFTPPGEVERQNRSWDVLGAWALPLCTVVGALMLWAIHATVAATG